MRSRGLGAVVVASLMVGSLTGCSGVESGASAKSQLLTAVDGSVQKFDHGGGSETTSVDRHQYALIFDPHAPQGRQVVTADLSDPASPAFGATSSIAIRSMTALISKTPSSQVKRSQDSYVIDSGSVHMQIVTVDQLVSEIVLSAGAGGSDAQQDILVTYGITPAARRIFNRVATP